tara:strand:- start:195 stop:995 length:801 start_codon:yes stop_codon:yes gene_type:complete
VKDHVYEHNTIILGGSFNSLLYSYFSDAPILIADPQPPFEFDEALEDYSFLGFDKEEPLKLINIWNRLYILISMRGNLLNPFEIQNWRLDEGELVVITPQNKKIVTKCNEHLVFDKETGDYNVYDWFDMISGGRHDRKVLEDYGSSFVNKIVFFPSKRPRIYTIKDTVAISKLSEQNLLDIKYSEGIARLKTLDMMKAVGMRGKKNGVNKKGKPLHYALKIQHSYREAKPILKNHMTIREILNIERNKGKMWKLTKDLFTHKTAST